MTNRDSVDRTAPPFGGAAARGQAPAVDTLCELSLTEAAQTVGGAGLDFNAIRQQAQAYCPATVARYSNVAPASVNRGTAQQMATSCLAEMGPFKAMFARGPIQHGIDQAFPATAPAPASHKGH